MKEVELVIAKYKENIDWIKLILHPTRIYDKSDTPITDSIPLPNVGREAHTFLYHIVKNYDNLADVTVFLQGNPFEHVEGCPSYSDKTIQDINSITKDSDFEPFYREVIRETSHTNFNIGGIFTTDMYLFSSGAQYIVPKAFILNRPLSLWKKLLDLSDTNLMYDTTKICPWSFERIWMMLFKGDAINPDFLK